MNKSIIEQIIEVLDKAKETAPKAIIAKLFNTLKADKEEDYKNFKEHVNDYCDCNCAIKEYYAVFDNLNDDELKEIIKENNITKDIYKNFDKILCDKCISNNTDIKSIMMDTNKRLHGIFDAVYENKPFEDMSKEELIDYIKKNK